MAMDLRTGMEPLPAFALALPPTVGCDTEPNSSARSLDHALGSVPRHFEVTALIGPACRGKYEDDRNGRG